MKRFLATIALLLAPAMALGQIAPVGLPRDRPPVGIARPSAREGVHTVDSVVVLPRAICLPTIRDRDVPAPRIVSVFPKPGAVLRPGLLVVRVTFDQPMSCDGFFFADTIFDRGCPEVRQDFLLSLDRKTVRTICRLPPSARFRMMLNETPVGPVRGVTDTFVSLAGWPAPRYQFDFTTNNAVSVRTLRDALLEDPDRGIALTKLD